MTNPFVALSTKKVVFLGLAVIGVSLLLVFSGVIDTAPAEAGSADNISGWAWSSNFGWISFNSTNDHNPDTAGVQPASVNYGVNLDEGTGFLSGYAWSDNVGWIRFGGLSGFPSGAGTQSVNAQLDGSNSLIGWARACTVFVSGCTGSLKPDSERGGWDGWISLHGSGYGVTLNGTNFEGFSWDGQNGSISVPPSADQFDGVGIGWIDWNPPFGGVTLAGSAPTVDLRIDGSNGPGSYTEPASYTLSWTTTNSPTSCTASGGDPSGAWPGGKDETGGNQSFSSVSDGSYTYALTCENAFGSDADSVVANVSAAAEATAELTADPPEVERGDESELSWTTMGAVDGTCEITGPSGTLGTGLPANGVGVNTGVLQTTSIFTLTCDTISGDPIEVTDNVTINVEEIIFHF